MAECVDCNKTCSIEEHYVECPHCHEVMCPECAEKHRRAMDREERRTLETLREGDAASRMSVLCPRCLHDMIFPAM